MFLSGAAGSGSDSTRAVLERRYERRLLEAYDAGCAAVDARPGGTDTGAVIADADPFRWRLERLPERIRRPRPDDVILFDSRDAPEIKLENAKKLARLFLMFHHGMRN